MGTRCRCAQPTKPPKTAGKATGAGEEPLARASRLSGSARPSGPELRRGPLEPDVVCLRIQHRSCSVAFLWVLPTSPGGGGSPGVLQSLATRGHAFSSELSVGAVTFQDKKERGPGARGVGEVGRESARRCWAWVPGVNGGRQGVQAQGGKTVCTHTSAAGRCVCVCVCVCVCATHGTSGDVRVGVWSGREGDRRNSACGGLKARRGVPFAVSGWPVHGWPHTVGGVEHVQLRNVSSLAGCVNFTSTRMAWSNGAGHHRGALDSCAVCFCALQVLMRVVSVLHV